MKASKALESTMRFSQRRQATQEPVILKSGRKRSFALKKILRCISIQRLSSIVNNSNPCISAFVYIYWSTSTPMKRFKRMKLLSATKPMTRNARYTFAFSRGCKSMPREFTMLSATSIQPSPVRPMWKSVTKAYPMWSKLESLFSHSPPLCKQSLRVSMSGRKSPLGSKEQYQSRPFSKFTKRMPKPK